MKKNNQKLIEVKNLSVHFTRNGRQFKALNNVSLDIEKGEIIGVVGESGSGKTTLGRAILGLWNHSSGNIKINGREVPKNRIKTANKKTDWVFKEGQMIFQDPSTSLNQKSKILDIVSEGYRNFKYYDDVITNEIKMLEEKIEKIQTQINDLRNTEEHLINIEEKHFKKHLEHLYTEAKKNNTSYQEVTKLNVEKEKLLKQKEETLNYIKTIKDDTKREIRVLKNEKYTNKLIFQNRTTDDNDYFKTSYIDEKNELELYQHKDVASEKFVKEDLSQIVSIITKDISNFNNQFKIIKKFVPISIKTKYFDEAKKSIKAFDALKKMTLEKFDASVRNITSFIENQQNKDIVNFRNYLDQRFELKSAVNTKIIRFLEKFVQKVVNKKIGKLKDEAFDLELLTKSIADGIKKIPLESERRISEDEIATFKYMAVLLKEKVDYYNSFLVLFAEQIKSHNANNIKDLYNFLYDSNKQFEKIHISMSSFLIRKKIIRTRNLLKVRIDSSEESLLSIENLLSEINQQLDNLNEDKILDEIRAKNSNAIEKLQNTRNKNILKIKQRHKTTSEMELAKIEILEKELEDSKKALIETKKKFGKKYKEEYIKEKVIETLKMVGISENAIHEFPGSFSGGQKQRIGIARAIINNPKFIVADEPISALDVSVQAQVVNLLKELRNKLKLTIIFIAHDLEMVHYISDKIAVIYKGDIVEYGSTKEIYKKPVHPYTISLMNSIPKIENLKQQLNLSSYDPSLHGYNNYKVIEFAKIKADHYVRGTKQEIDQWKALSKKKNKSK